MQEQFSAALDDLVKVGLMLLVALVSWLGAQAVAWLKAHTKNAQLAGLAERLDQAVTIAVQAVEQEVVKKFANGAGNKLDPSAAAQAKAAAVDAAKTILTTTDAADLKTTRGLDEAQFNRMLADHVEARVNGSASLFTALDTKPGIVAAVAVASPETKKEGIS